MDKKILYWKLAWDTFHLQVFDYESDANRINNWIKGKNYKAENTLEIGCGAGRYLKFLKKFGYNCVGLDIDDKILEYARETALQEDKDVELVKGDILKRIPSFLKERFDLVLAKHLSFALFDLEKVLDYAKKALNPKGPKLLVFDFMVANKDNLDKEILSIDSAVKGFLFLVRLNRMELRKELNGYIWEEFYIIRDTRGRTTFTKTNTRSLWFLRSSELNKLLKEKGVEIENELEEDTGINNLKGVTIYGKFK